MKKNEEKEVKKEKVVDTTVSEIVTLNNKIKELEEKVLYKDAELLNYKKRKDLEVSSMLKYANSDIILEMLSIVDDLERAIKLDDNILDDEVSKFLSGIKIIYSRLISILEKYEVKEIDALNKEFDPTYHQAVLTEKVEGVKPNIVVEVLQKGYMYKDKVIRHTMVKVSE
ncbi:MAG: nucleotide exchange factor GrpE [Tenericutes bacterium]|nr:nucleotide exchange factor GrpE [Mycoplasmatota bacterium]